MSTLQDPPPDLTTPALVSTLPHRIRECDGKKSGLHIVVFKNGVDQSEMIAKIASSDTTTKITYKYHVINAIAGVLSKEYLHTLCNSTEVEFIEESGYIEPAATQADAPWGLNRLSAADPKPIEGKVEGKSVNALNFSYHYDEPADDAPVVNIYVVDDGVRITHDEFNNERADWIPLEFQPVPAADPDSDWRRVVGAAGHGTAVAAVAAGARWGVAKIWHHKNAHIIAVRLYHPQDNQGPRVVDGIAAFEAVKNHAEESNRPSVLNYSFVGPRSGSLDKTVKKITDAGIHFVAGAGNNKAFAGNYSPGHCDTVICVGASDFHNMIWEDYDEDGQLFQGSNFGAAVTVFAPGVNITTAGWDSDDAIRGPHSISGTSLAAPYVSGLIAYLISIRKLQDLSPKDMKQLIVDMAHEDVLNNYHLGGSPNRLAYNGFTVAAAN